MDITDAEMEQAEDQRLDGQIADHLEAAHREGQVSLREFIVTIKAKSDEFDEACRRINMAVHTHEWKPTLYVRNDEFCTECGILKSYVDADGGMPF